MDYEKHRRTLQRDKNRGIPNSPLNCAEVHQVFENENVMEVYGRSLHADGDQPNILLKHVNDDENVAYCLFASDKIINKIKANIAVDRRHLLMDATFKVCPFGSFKQLLIIYIGYMDKVTEFCIIYFAYNILYGMTSDAFFWSQVIPYILFGITRGLVFFYSALHSYLF